MVEPENSICFVYRREMTMKSLYRGYVVFHADFA